MRQTTKQRMEKLKGYLYLTLLFPFSWPGMIIIGIIGGLLLWGG